MRRLIDPRLWSVQTRLAALVLIPAFVIVTVVIDSPMAPLWGIVAIPVVPWLVIAPWAKRRSRSDIAPSDTAHP